LPALPPRRSLATPTRRGRAGFAGAAVKPPGEDQFEAVMRSVRFAAGNLRSLRLMTAKDMGRLSFRSFDPGLILVDERSSRHPSI
jgi:hypothetical protein